MRVEVINTGTEILLGNVVNSHLAFFAKELFPIGLRIERQVTVPDGTAIRDALSEALERAEVIFVTGGLGPTTDDVTREISAELLDLPMHESAEVLQAIAERFARRGIVMTERVKRQAQVPVGATVLANACGTAPGLYLKTDALHLFLLPGPPRELKPMFRESVLPILKTIAPQKPTFACRSFRVVGIGESNVEALVGEEILAIEGIELGYCARPGEVDVRCIGTPEMLDRAERIVLSKLGDQIAALDESSLEETVVRELTARGKKLAVAESCTGGFVAHRITNVPGASAVFLAGFVTYADEAKTRELGVPADLIAQHGAVSAEVARAMAAGAMEKSDAHFALSTTGIAGPDGGTEAKPVGTVFIALASRGNDVQVQQHKFPTDRENFKWLASQAALDLLRRSIAW
ncbi:MAG: nicotinamide-nucleotide amidase [Chthoniobacter sp.]|jgi:nicotinamide-nucleotide amidase|nr:nicotinamide-nucleotide amidase [Chthoniobacter sp.]